MRSYQYDAVIDIMLSEPGVSLSEIARRLGKTPAWMTWVTKSDAFRDIYDERRRLKNEATSEELHLALTKVAQSSLEILTDRLDKNPAGIPTQMVLDVADKALERLGYGVKLPGTVIDARSASVTLNAADFAVAQSVVRGLELENSERSPKPGRNVVAMPVNPLRSARGTPEEVPATTVRDLLDAHGFAVGAPPPEDASEE